MSYGTMRHSALAEALQDGTASPQNGTQPSKPGTQSQEVEKPEANSNPESPQEPQQQDLAGPDSLQTPLPEKLQNLKISSNSKEGGKEGVHASSDSDRDSAALRSTLQSLKGGLKAKTAVKEQKSRHKARKGYLIKGYAHTFDHA